MKNNYYLDVFMKSGYKIMLTTLKEAVFRK